ncbi:MAG: hybrid sensor histidine kinase/response regulator [Deltaproteobacteria bacterium]|nr:MAG: hybrid sensor histidine kinase/response regulator [Deltaproteobacteria bacterium]
MEILVVEDNAVSAALVKKILSKSGYGVLLVNNGQQAWELFREKRPRLIISDWIMPEMSGVSLCRNVRSLDDVQYTYIILVTARENIEDMAEAFDAGVDDYLTKPFSSRELLVRVKAGERIIQLEENIHNVQQQLLQSEKMASIGQLAAGVAHEINNPTGFVNSNLTTLSEYQRDIKGVIGQYRKLISDLGTVLPDGLSPPALAEQITEIRKRETEIDIDFILDDIDDLIRDCREGTERIKKIVIDLKDFAHPGEDEKKSVDINQGLESTLNVVWNELKYKADVRKDYGDIPIVEGYPQQLNQVFMNILVNAAQAIEERGEIRISTRKVNGYVEVSISDTGSGIPEENLPRIFDPFFTTKEVGKGTGLGMNVAYNIIRKHNGSIDVKSKVGEGTTFRIRIPAESC